MTKYFFIFYGLLIWTCLSCNTEPYVQQIKNEVWTTIEQNGEIIKNNISLIESFEYNKKGIEMAHLIYDTEGILAGKEVSEYKIFKSKPIKTNYYSATGQLLTYYELVYDDQNRHIFSNGFDGSSNQKLRSEKFSYNDFDQLIKKEIIDAEGNLQRTYEYEYDKFGNEIKNTAKDFDGNIRLVDDFNITKYNDDNQWLECWVSRNNQPYNYKKREFLYSK